MKVFINSCQPDGIAVEFKEPFIFDTLKEAYEFIEKVYETYNKRD